MLIISNCKRVGSIVSKSKDTHMATYERSSNLQKGLMGPNIILSRNPLSHNPIIMQHCMWSQKCSFKFHGTHSNPLFKHKTHSSQIPHFFFFFFAHKKKTIQNYTNKASYILQNFIQLNFISTCIISGEKLYLFFNFYDIRF
jgi:hypothetical protein